MTISLEQAEIIANGALTYARANQVAPLAITILDTGGQMVVFKREDHASLYRGDIATAKAKCALGMGFNTRDLAEKAKGNPIFFTSLAALNDIEFAFSPGGNLIKDNNGQLLGAIGISGDIGAVDEQCALAGIKTLFST